MYCISVLYHIICYDNFSYTICRYTVFIFANKPIIIIHLFNLKSSISLLGLTETNLCGG